MILGVILSIIAGSLILVGLVALAILCTPLRVSAAFDTAARPTFRVKMALFGGLLPISFAPGKAPKRRRQPKPRTKPPARKPTRVAVHAPRMLRNGPRFATKLISQVKLEGLDAHIRFGFPDPADTGMVYGALTPATRCFRHHVSLQPDFDGAVLAGRGRIAARLTPATLIPPVLGFAWAVFVTPRQSRGAR